MGGTGGYSESKSPGSPLLTMELLRRAIDFLRVTSRLLYSTYQQTAAGRFNLSALGHKQLADR